MANAHLFPSSRGRLLPAATVRNAEAALSYRFDAKHELAQFAATGCFNNTFYASGASQLDRVLALANELDVAFVAKAAIYAREHAHMKDMPAFLLAVLAKRDAQLLKRVFARVIDNGRMLRSFVQIVRSGATGRKSLGSAPKALVQAWLDAASDRQLIDALVGNAPSLADVVRMVHPKPAGAGREAFYGWLLDKPYVLERLPAELQAFEAYKLDRSQPVPRVPFQMLTALGLSREAWAALARQGNWHMVRMNLNTFARRGVFEIEGMADVVAAKLADPEAIAKARVMPYQLMAAYLACGPEIPVVVRDALQDAMELALANVGSFAGRVVVCPDVSGSMASPVTGVRRGATSSVRCIDVAALMAAALLRTGKNVRVLPFENDVCDLVLSSRDSVLTNASKLASIGGGGTNCSAPLHWLNSRRERADLVIFVSDNQSWVDARANGPTEMMRHWEALKVRNPGAKLVCIDVQPYATTQAMEREDVLNIGGFSDEVFAAVQVFASGMRSAQHWVERIEAIEL